MDDTGTGNLKYLIANAKRAEMEARKEAEKMDVRRVGIDSLRWDWVELARELIGLEDEEANTPTAAGAAICAQGNARSYARQWLERRRIDDHDFGTTYEPADILVEFAREVLGPMARLAQQYERLANLAVTPPTMIIPLQPPSDAEVEAALRHVSLIGWTESDVRAALDEFVRGRRG